MTDFKKLIVWQRGIEFTKAVYEATKPFPETEADGLVSQLRRAAVSIPTNIAEGCARQSDREQARYFRISLASARELESLIRVSGEVGYLSRSDGEPLEAEVDEIQRMLNALIKHRMRAGITRTGRRLEGR